MNLAAETIYRSLTIFIDFSADKICTPRKDRANNIEIEL